MNHLLIFLSVFFVVPLAAAPRPNVIVILADDLGFSDLGGQWNQWAARAHAMPKSKPDGSCKGKSEGTKTNNT